MPPIGSIGPRIKAVKWDATDLAKTGPHRRGGYFYGPPDEQPCIWDIKWKGVIDREQSIMQAHRRKMNSSMGMRRSIDVYDVYVAFHSNQASFANKVCERLSMSGYSVLGNEWFCKPGSPRAYKGNSGTWERSEKPWRAEHKGHLSPNRPTGTGAQELELLLDQGRAVVAIMTPEAWTDTTFVRQVTTAKRLGKKIVCVQLASSPVHRDYTAATLAASCLLVTWHADTESGNEACTYKIVSELQMVGVFADEYAAGFMSSLGKADLLALAKKKEVHTTEENNRITVFPPLSSPSNTSVPVELENGVTVDHMNAQQLGLWLSESLGFCKAICAKFCLTSGIKLSRMSLADMKAQFGLSNFVAKKVLRALEENIHPGTVTFQKIFLKQQRSQTGKMISPAEMSVSHVQAWLDNLEGLGSTKQAVKLIKAVLRDHGVSGEDIVEMDKHDFIELGIGLSDAAFLVEEARVLKFHGIPQKLAREWAVSVP